MALNTKEKRQSIPSIGRPWLRNTFPIATPDEQWRMSIGNVYGGNVLSAATLLPGGAIYIEGGSVRKAVLEIGGLFHLVGEAVVVLSDGNVVSGKTVSSTGTITLDRKGSRVHVGKRVIADVETLDVETPRGTIQSLKRRATHATLQLQKTRGLLIGPNSSKLRQMKFREFEKMSNPTDLLTGSKRITLDPTWRSNGRMFIRQPFPLPMTILAIIPKVDIEKRNG